MGIKQWQPMYLEIINTVSGIELSEGITSNIDCNDFLDVSERNFIVLDDLMDQSWGDKRIANLFSRSLHRNLVVIYIVRNIFHQDKKKTETSVLVLTILCFLCLPEINNKIVY